MQTPRGAALRLGRFRKANSAHESVSTGKGKQIGLFGALLLAIVSSLLTLFASSTTTLISTQAVARNEAVSQRRAKLEQYLSLGYQIRDDLGLNAQRRWVRAIMGQRLLKQDPELEKLDAYVDKRGDALNQFRAISAVYFPELDQESHAVVLAALAADAKSRACLLESIQIAAKSGKTFTVKEIFPQLSCIQEHDRLLSELDLKTQKLIDAARTRLRVFFFDADMVPVNATAAKEQR